MIGLLAGSGRFPILFAEAARRQGLQVACVGIRYEAPPELRDLCARFRTVGVAKLGRMIRTFDGWGVERIVMAGKVTKNVMYSPLRIVQLCPDLRMFQMWYRRLSKDKRDDSILLGVIAEFANDGMTFASALDYCPELLVKEGILTRRAPTLAERRDIEFGWSLAKEMGRLDVGQSVAVKEPRRSWRSEADHRGDRPSLHRARRAALPGGGMEPREGRQTAAGHAVRRPDNRHLDDHEPPPGRGPRAGDRGREDHRDRSARSRRPGRSPRPDDRRPPRSLGRWLMNFGAEASPVDLAVPLRDGRTGIALAAILLVAVAVRVFGLDRHSLWYDEVVTMTVARQHGPWAALETLRRIDSTRAPLHPLLLEGWIALFGPSDLAGRSLSAVFGVLTVLLVYWIARQAYEPPVACWGAALAAISPLGVQYSQDVRMYALLTTITCLCWGLLFSFRRSASAWRQAAFALSLTALVYCHPLGGLMVVALALGYLIDRPSSQLRPGSWLLIHLAMALALAPWVDHYLDHPPDLKPMAPGRLFNWPRFFIGGHSSTLAVCGLLIAWGLLAVLRREAEGRSESRASLMALVWFLIPPALIYAYSRLSHPIFGPIRYVVFVAPGYLLLVARGLAALPRCLRYAVALLGLLATIAALQGRVYHPDTKPDWRAAARIVRRVDPGAPVIMFCREPHMYPHTIPYYLDEATRVVTVERHARELAAGHQEPTAHAWFVVDQHDGAIVKEAPEPLKSLYEPVRSWTLDRVRIGYYRLRAIEKRTALKLP